MPVEYATLDQFHKPLKRAELLELKAYWFYTFIGPVHFFGLFPGEGPVIRKWLEKHPVAQEFDIEIHSGRQELGFQLDLGFVEMTLKEKDAEIEKVREFLREMGRTFPEIMVHPFPIKHGAQRGLYEFEAGKLVKSDQDDHGVWEWMDAALAGGDLPPRQNPHGEAGN